MTQYSYSGKCSLQLLIYLFFIFGQFQSDVNPKLPMFIFGAMALIGGAVVFVLPETSDQPMSQTVEEG